MSIFSFTGQFAEPDETRTEWCVLYTDQDGVVRDLKIKEAAKVLRSEGDHSVPTWSLLLDDSIAQNAQIQWSKLANSNVAGLIVCNSGEPPTVLPGVDVGQFLVSTGAGSVPEWMPANNLYWDAVQKFLGVNQSLPQADLHVGGDTIVDGDLRVIGSLSVGELIDVEQQMVLRCMSWPAADEDGASATSGTQKDMPGIIMLEDYIQWDPEASGHAAAQIASVKVLDLDVSAFDGNGKIYFFLGKNFLTESYYLGAFNSFGHAITDLADNIIEGSTASVVLEPYSPYNLRLQVKFQIGCPNTFWDAANGGVQIVPKGVFLYTKRHLTILNSGATNYVFGICKTTKQNWFEQNDIVIHGKYKDYFGDSGLLDGSMYMNVEGSVVNKKFHFSQPDTKFCFGFKLNDDLYITKTHISGVEE